MESYGFLLIGLVVGAVIGLFYARSKQPKNGSSEGAEREVSVLREQLSKLEAVAEADRARREKEAQEESVLLQAIAPVKTHLEQMQLKVAELERERTSQFNTIEEQLRLARETEKTLTESTVALANAMSNNQVRGQWGELQLKRTIEAAGMLKHVDFHTQEVGVNADGKGIKPDAVIHMADGKFVAVDSKAPFNNFQRASAIATVASEDQNKERIKLLKQHAADVKRHIDEIGKKDYFSGLAASPEFTLMFIPSEAVLSLTLEHDPTLLEYAFSQKVALVSPVSFYSVLKSIAYTWQQSAQESTIKEIITLGVKLHKNIRSVAEHAVKLGKNISDSVINYNGFIASVERNLLTSTRELNKKSKNILDQGKLIPEVPEISDQIEGFTKPEITAPLEELGE